MDLDLKGKVAIIVGGANGIGKEIALTLAHEGAILVIADINLNDARTLSEEINDSGTKAIAIEVDVTNYSYVERMVETVLDEYHCIDILVNCAGYISIAAPLDVDESEWNKTMDVNAKGVFLCCRAVAKHMVRRSYGKIVNISSQASKIAYPFEAPYSASKAALNGFTRAMAMYLAQHNINVNAVCPGSIETEMNEKVTRDTAKLLGISVNEKRQATIKSTPLKRKGTVADIAPMVAFLVSDKASFITGQTINITGGRVMH